ncbi:MAG TPA: CPBP family intramembrane glutamic endopeptidase [Phycisphaerae bacterium]|nr:CPBP family intramembrane glutamic endopeptidase [Phycisphaerae bacterium]
MPTPLTRLDIAELAVVAAGLIIILAGAIIVSRRRAWRELINIPPPSSNVLEPADLLIGLAAILMLSSVIFKLLSIGAAPVADEPVTSQPDAADPREVLALALGQTLAAALIALIARQRFHGGLSGWGLTTTHFGQRVGQAIIGYLAAWSICLALLHLTVLILQWTVPDFAPPEHSAILTLLSAASPPWVIIVTIISTSVLAPTLEEFFFRGLLQPALIRWTNRPWAAILIAGTAFGLFHYPLIHTIPALAVFGVFLGYLYAKTRSLTLVILLHAVFNAKTLLWLAIGADGQEPQ